MVPLAIGAVIAIAEIGLEAAKIVQAVRAEGRDHTTPEETARLRAGSDDAHADVQGT